jgi:dihydroorotate dehydrogenase (NAD+) catalytic subunit
LTDINLDVKLGNIILKNPVIACSGTFASGLEFNDFYDTSILGAVTTKSFSLDRKTGNKPPRIWETACGILNSIGLQNEGIDYFIKEQLPAAAEKGIKIILSIFGEDVEEFKKIAFKILKIKHDILGIELNLSCPNVEKGGMIFCAAPEIVEIITKSVIDIAEIPVIVKLSPNTDKIIDSAVAAKKGGATAISIINTLIGTAVDIETFKPRLGNITGGLSGPAIKPIALAKVYSIAKENILPIIGMGGIYNWQDAIEFLIMGARAVGIGTANFSDIHACQKIINGITEYMRIKKITDINDIIGKVNTG